MSETTTATATPKTSAATNGKAAPAKKAARKATPAASANGKAAAAKTGLRKAQVRVLEALAKAKEPLSRKAAAAAAGMPHSGLTFELGAVKDEVRKANDASHYPSLLSLGAVKLETPPEDGEDRGIRYTVTARGRQLLAKAAK